ISREAFRLWKEQRMGGSLIFVASKNSVVASRNAAAYNTAKAAELHLARSLAEEGGPIGVRVNSVLPDAVLQDSGIWDAGWRDDGITLLAVRQFGGMRQHGEPAAVSNQFQHQRLADGMASQCSLQVIHRHDGYVTNFGDQVSGLDSHMGGGRIRLHLHDPHRG